MSSAADYFRSHAIEAARKARRMEHGRMRNKQRIVASVYRLLARSAEGRSLPVIGEVTPRYAMSGDFGTTQVRKALTRRRNANADFSF
jgi:hypothetical protein